MTPFDTLLAADSAPLAPEAKRAVLLEGLNALTRHHAEHCPAYGRVLAALWDGRREAEGLEDVPWLPVALFKTTELRSVAAEAVQVTLTSSGTTGQAVSRIAVDGETAGRQARALSAALKTVLGAKRLPMLLIDTPTALTDPRLISARGAGLAGLMRHGRDHVFALRPDLSVDLEAVTAFLDRHGHAPFALFGFTFLVWTRLVEPLRGRGLDLSQGVLIHSGGWKRMQQQAVDAQAFRQGLAESLNLRRSHDFYGMVEQIGSIFIEGPGGALRPPAVSAVIIRDPVSWRPQPAGTPGVIQVLSLIPRSYPGHSLLTEDWGVVDGEGGLRVLGRVKRAELRGCSDVLAASS